MGFFHEGAIIFHVAGGVGILQYAGEDVRREFHFGIFYTQLDTLRNGAGSHYRQCLREDGFVNKDHVGTRISACRADAGHTSSSRLRLRQSLRPAGSSWQGHAGEVAYGSLEVHQASRRPVRLRSDRGIGSVPNGVFEYIPLDNGRSDGIVPSHTDIGCIKFVFGSQSCNVLSEFVLVIVLGRASGSFRRMLAGMVLSISSSRLFTPIFGASSPRLFR